MAFMLEATFLGIFVFGRDRVSDARYNRIEVAAVGLAGGPLAAPLTDPPGFFVHLSTTLAAVPVLFSNVDALVDPTLAIRRRDR